MGMWRNVDPNRKQLIEITRDEHVIIHNQNMDTGVIAITLDYKYKPESDEPLVIYDYAPNKKRGKDLEAFEIKDCSTIYWKNNGEIWERVESLETKKIW